MAERQRELGDFKKARVKNDGLTITLLWISTSVSAAADRPASYGNQTISSTRPSNYIPLSTVDVINIAADHQMFMTLPCELR